MFLYNITFIVEDAAASVFQSYLAQTFLKQVQALNLFSHAHILKVVDSPNEGQTFCVQLKSETQAAYEQFTTENSPELIQALHHQFEHQYVAFHSFMEYLS